MQKIHIMGKILKEIEWNKRFMAPNLHCLTKLSENKGFVKFNIIFYHLNGVSTYCAILTIF